ncbi:MAG: RdgB/HAM1 family non-canonical purine NTP pyrophosphatase [Proteobacteria bacterium]|nr:RdgB/HAM1 family non-canonical purine NTP pyrophosphatase [Pseudomonadota bacterium]
MNLSRGILLATSNKGKLKEIRQILGEVVHVQFYTLSDVNAENFDVEENGKTFKENALIKAKAYAEKFGFVTLADDSGLEVDYLKGAPGVKSARYAGTGAKDSDLYNKVLKELKGVPSEKRTARFKCVICLYDPEDVSYIFSEGVCEGVISTIPAGSNGFGYDPVFIPDGFAPKTIAELDPKIKNSISHRGRALEALKSKLLQN